jgi:hypothetical protein
MEGDPMNKFFLIMTAVLMTLQLHAQTCSEQLASMKKESYFMKLSEDTQRVITFGSTTTGLAVGLTVASSAFPAFLITASIAASPILVGDSIKSIQNRPLNRMIRLIKQSEKFANDPSLKPGRLLLRLHRRLESSKLVRDISILELAMTISNANNDHNNCGALKSIKTVNSGLRDGSLTVVELSEDLDVDEP